MPILGMLTYLLIEVDGLIGMSLTKPHKKIGTNQNSVFRV